MADPDVQLSAIRAIPIRPGVCMLLRTRDELTAIARVLRAWDTLPDVFFARARCEAVGWKE